MPIVTALTSFPVKGCAGTSVPWTALTPAGLAHDRAFMVVDEGGTFRSQRKDPRLAQVRPRVGGDGRSLTLDAPGAGAVSIRVDLDAERREVTLFGTPYRGIDQGDAAAGWLSEFLGRPARLVRVPPEHDRVTGGALPGTAGWADSGAVLVASTASLDALNARIAARGAHPVPMDRFRANIVVDGFDAPHAEDGMHRLVIGTAELGFAKLCIRCVVTTVDQSAGERAGPEPLRTLADYRRFDGGVAFGAKFSVVRTGVVAVGDPIGAVEHSPALP